MQANQPICFILILQSFALWMSCNSSEKIQWLNIEKDLQTQLIMADDGDTVAIPEGYFLFTSSLSMDEKNNIVIKGAGMNRTFLSFTQQTEGAEGLKITNGNNIQIQDLTVQDTKGNAIKAQDINGITFLNVRTTWSGKPKSENGAYGFYPVQCQSVLIDACEASGASDAGIYVGQSKYVVVKNCSAFHNVAGIEIENTLYADVFNNHAFNNTGGILVFDMPDLKQKKGGFVRIFDNIIEKNNHTNFAPLRNIVGKVPAGTGFMVLSTSNVEVFKNKISKNKSFNASIISFTTIGSNAKDSDYDPYPKSIFVHDNMFEQFTIHLPDWSNKMGQLALFKFLFNTPDIIYDGVFDEKLGLKNSNICIKNNGDATFANINAPENFKNILADIQVYNCSLKQLNPVEL